MQGDQLHPEDQLADSRLRLTLGDSCFEGIRFGFGLKGSQKITTH